MGSGSSQPAQIVPDLSTEYTPSQNSLNDIGQIVAQFPSHPHPFLATGSVIRKSTSGKLKILTGAQAVVHWDFYHETWEWASSVTFSCNSTQYIVTQVCPNPIPPVSNGF